MDALRKADEPEVTHESLTPEERDLEIELLDACDEVVREALRAHRKHGRESQLTPGHSVGKRLGILGEEFGEVCRATTYDNGSEEDLRKELIQVAAMAVTWVVSELSGGAAPGQAQES